MPTKEEIKRDITALTSLLDVQAGLLVLMCDREDSKHEIDKQINATHRTLDTLRSKVEFYEKTKEAV